MHLKVTTLTPRLSARLSTSAQLMGLEVSPSTASSAPTELSSTRTTSSATGGSTLTAPLLRISTASMMRLLLRETLWPETRHSTAPLQSMVRPPLLSEIMTQASEATRMPGEPPGDSQATREEDEEVVGAGEVMEGEDKPDINLIDRDLENLLREGDHSRYNHFNLTLVHQTLTVIL